MCNNTYDELFIFNYALKVISESSKINVLNLSPTNFDLIAKIQNLMKSFL